MREQPESPPAGLPTLHQSSSGSEDEGFGHSYHGRDYEIIMKRLHAPSASPFVRRPVSVPGKVAAVVLPSAAPPPLPPRPPPSATTAAAVAVAIGGLSVKSSVTPPPSPPRRVLGVEAGAGAGVGEGAGAEAEESTTELMVRGKGWRRPDEEDRERRSFFLDSRLEATLALIRSGQAFCEERHIVVDFVRRAKPSTDGTGAIRADAQPLDGLLR
eukprot:jgi/Undpi1/1423/HiC_scaffold_11.g04814.m1